MDTGAQLADQLAFHWEHHLWPRLAGLTDDEYLWEPVAGCWSVRRREDARTSHAAGSGPYVIDYEVPPPEPAPVTTIAWRLGHVTVGCLGMRAASHFGGPPHDLLTHPYPGDAATALQQLEGAYTAWMEGVRSLDDAALARPVGEAEGPWAEHPMITLVLHIHREVIHHGAEICLLRDLYAHR
ncbi:MAG: DinB family protein [Mobilicoccus sp.]|nr:DinB family protein [Mobilicoccus sp.]